MKPTDATFRICHSSGGLFPRPDAKDLILPQRLNGAGGDEVDVDRVANRIKHFHCIAGRAITGGQFIDEDDDIAFAKTKIWQVHGLSLVRTEDLGEHVGEDASGAVVVDLDWGVDTDDEGDVEAGAVGSGHA